jgi:8-oxo-dGTP pyrophosphatase MutT (NUDIX family)
VQQAGALAYRLVGSEPRFLLVTSRSGAGEWIFPKGHLEPGEAPAAAAIRELREEAGVEGRALMPLGTLRFRSGDEDVEVSYFLVEASTPGQGSEGRELRWLPLKKAIELASHADAKELLRSAARKLGLTS